MAVTYYKPAENLFNQCFIYKVTTQEENQFLS